MPTDDLAAICRFAAESFPRLQRITVYGSSQYVVRKGLAGVKTLREAGLRRIHVGLARRIQPPRYEVGCTGLLAEGGTCEVEWSNGARCIGAALLGLGVGAWV
jgi:hypothetical protein